MIHAATVIASQLNIFDIVEQETGVGELAAKTGADELLLREFPSSRHKKHRECTILPLGSSYHAGPCFCRHLHAAASRRLRGHQVLAEVSRAAGAQLGSWIVSHDEQNGHQPT